MSKKNKHNRMNISEAMGILNCSEQQIIALINTGDLTRYPSNNKAGYTVSAKDVREHKAQSKKWEKNLEVNVSRGGMTGNAPPTVEQGEGIFFSFGEVAKQLDRTPSLVARWIKNLKLPVHIIDGYKYIDGFELSNLQKMSKNKQRRQRGPDRDESEDDDGLDKSDYMSSPEACDRLNIGAATIWALANDGTIGKRKFGNKSYFLREDIERYRPEVLDIKGMKYWPAETVVKKTGLKPHSLYSKTTTGEWKGTKHNGRCYYSVPDVEQYCSDKSFDDAPTFRESDPTAEKFVNNLNTQEPHDDDVLFTAKQAGAYVAISEKRWQQLMKTVNITTYNYHGTNMYRQADVEGYYYNKYTGKHKVTRQGTQYMSEPLAAHILKIRPTAVKNFADDGRFKLTMIDGMRMYHHKGVHDYLKNRRSFARRSDVVILAMLEKAAPEVEIEEVETVTQEPVKVVPVEALTPKPKPEPPAPPRVDKLTLVRDAMALANSNPEIAKLALEALKG